MIGYELIVRIEIVEDLDKYQEIEKNILDESRLAGSESSPQLNLYLGFLSSTLIF